MGTPRKNSFHYDVYPQTFQNVSSSGGVLALTINYSWYDITLTENISSITTSSDPGSTRAFSFSILVTQSSTTAYTIDWFSSGKFYSNLSAGALQPPTELGKSARYTCVWDGTRYRVYIDSPYTIPTEAFQIRVETVSAAQTVPLPFLSSATYDAVIDWGDGVITTATAWNDTGASHQYSIAGQYVISISGYMGAFSTALFFNLEFRPFLTEIISFGRGVLPYITDLSFNGCTNLTAVVNEFNFSGDTLGMFQGCTGLTTLDLSGWDVSGITGMTSFLAGCTGITSLNLNGWNLSNVTTLTQFMGGVPLSALDLSSWTVTSNLINVVNFAQNCSNLITLNVTGWDTSNVSSLGGFVQGCTSLTTLTGIDSWNTSSVESLFFAFKDTSSLINLNLSSWDMSSVLDLNQPFEGSNLANLNIFTSIGTTTTQLDRVFVNLAMTSLDLSGWDVSSVTDMEDVVSNCTSLTTLNVSTWDISNVTNLGAFLLNTPISTASFDSLLIGWTGWVGGVPTKSVQSGLTIFSNLTSFTPASDAADAANWLVTVKGWTIV